MVKVCRCGIEFETKLSKKIYCSKHCQMKFSKDDAWEKVKQDYRFRCRQLCAMAKSRSKFGNLPFNITKEYLINLWNEQEGRCAISGRKFDLARPLENETVKANAPSLDRIKPASGYIEGNVRFVCYQVNTALNAYGEEALYKLCKDILNYQGSVV